jgi:hypothetical protein
MYLEDLSLRASPVVLRGAYDPCGVRVREVPELLLRGRRLVAVPVPRPHLQPPHRAWV